MLNNARMYKFMTVKQLNKRIDEIKMQLDNEETFEERLKLLDDLAVIVGILLRKCRHNIKVMKYVTSKLKELEALTN